MSGLDVHVASAVLRAHGLVLVQFQADGDTRVCLPDGPVVYGHLNLRGHSVPGGAWAGVRRAARRYGIELPSVSQAACWTAPAAVLPSEPELFDVVTAPRSHGTGRNPYAPAVLPTSTTQTPALSVQDVVLAWLQAQPSPQALAAVHQGIASITLGEVVAAVRELVRTGLVAPRVVRGQKLFAAKRRSLP